MIRNRAFHAVILAFFCLICLSDTYAGEKIDINTATAKELASLPGIGEKKAQAIVSFREKKGAFPSVDALIEVPGIGKKTLEKILHLIQAGKIKNTPMGKQSGTVKPGAGSVKKE